MTMDQRPALERPLLSAGRNKHGAMDIELLADHESLNERTVIMGAVSPDREKFVADPR